MSTCDKYYKVKVTPELVVALEKEFAAAPELWVFTVCAWPPSKTNSACLFGFKAAGLCSIVPGSRQKLPSCLPSLVRGDLAAGGGGEGAGERVKTLGKSF